MKDIYEEYVQPPSYTDIHLPDDPLIAKLRLRIQQDLNQINGVYDCQISECEQNKSKRMKEIELEHNSIVENINKQRREDINRYNEKAENHIDNLISSMNNSTHKKTQNWWDWFIPNYIDKNSNAR